MGASTARWGWLAQPDSATGTSYSHVSRRLYKYNRTDSGGPGEMLAPAEIIVVRVDDGAIQPAATHHSTCFTAAWLALVHARNTSQCR